MDIYEPGQIALEVEEIDGTLRVGTVDTGVYGNNFGGATDSDGIVTFEVDAGGRGLIIEFDTYDIDYAGEVAVYVNDVFVGIAAKGASNGMGEGIVTVEDYFVDDGINIVQFVAMAGTDNTWGVTNIAISPEPALVFGEFNSDEYGNRFGGMIDTDGTISFQFFPDLSEDLTLYVQGYDIDYYGEVEVFLNGVSIGFMEAGPNNGMAGSSFDFAVEDMVDGSNVVEFRLNGPTARA